MYQFGPFRFDPGDCLLFRGDQIVSLPPKALETLRCLLEHHGSLVEKEELIKTVWPDSFVEEGALTQNIFRLRKALDSHAQIETVPRRGYRFMGKVEVGSPEAQTESRPFRRSLLVGGLSAAVLIGAGALLGRRSSASSTVFPEVRRLTRSGKVIRCAISPDERLAAYVVRENQGSSLWVVELDGGGTWRALGPVSGRWGGVTFAPDASQIYFVLDNTLETLLPTGAERRKLQDDVDEAPAISPSADRIAFVREDLDRGETAVILSAPDGSHASRIATRKLPAFFQEVTWRPDGAAIVASVGKVADAREMSLVELDANDSSERVIGSHRWDAITGIAFSAAGDCLYIAAAQRHWSGGQLWRVSYPQGNTAPLTRDAMNYFGLSVSREGALATTGGSKVSSLAILRGPEPGGITSLSAGSESARAPVCLDRDSIVYEALRGEQPQIWSMRPDGSGRRQLTTGDCASVSPAVATSAGLIFYVSECAAGSSLWSMDRNGASPRPVCSGVGLGSPACTPDGRSIFFTSTRDGKPSLWRVDRDRGQPVQVNDRLSRMPAVAPDGKQVAFYYWSERDNEPRRIVSMPVSGGEPKPLLDLDDGDVLKCLRWDPSGRSLHLLLRRQAVTEVWRHSLAGGSLVLITNFRDDRTVSFDLLDPPNLVFAREEGWSDVLLIHTAHS